MKLALAIVNVESDLQASFVAVVAQEALKTSFALCNKPEGEFVKIEIRKSECQPGISKPVPKVIFEVDESVLRTLATIGGDKADDNDSEVGRLREYASGIVFGIYIVSACVLSFDSVDEV